jgi:hypothetical protein
MQHTAVCNVMLCESFQGFLCDLLLLFQLQTSHSEARFSLKCEAVCLPISNPFTILLRITVLLKLDFLEPGFCVS